MADDDGDYLDALEGEVMKRASPKLRKMIRSQPVADAPRAAYHEAGHAVAAIRCGLPVAYVFIERNRDGEWEGTTNVPLSLEEMVDWEREHNNFLLFVCAGIAADRKRGTTSDFGWSHDMAKVSEILGGIDEPRDQRKDREHSAREGARTLVRTSWPTIEVVAQALLKSTRLEREELQRLVNGEPGASVRTHRQNDTHG